MLLSNIFKKSKSIIKENIFPTSSSTLTFCVVFKNKKLEKYLTDEDGRALYYFKRFNTKTLNVCPSLEDKDHLGVWQIFYKDKITVPKPLKRKDFSVIIRSDKRKQILYKGNPLYCYANDLNLGDIKGDGINGEWFVVKIKSDF